MLSGSLRIQNIGKKVPVFFTLTTNPPPLSCQSRALSLFSLRDEFNVTSATLCCDSAAVQSRHFQFMTVAFVSQLSINFLSFFYKRGQN